MMHGGGGWHSYMRFDEKEDRPRINVALLRRVAGYAGPYRKQILLMLVTLLALALLSLISPLLFRDMIDHALPNRDLPRLNLLAIGMIGVPLISGLVTVLQRYLSAGVGEGVICDLRKALFAHMQMMSLRFFTRTRTGELMSRLNNDVVGSQQAITNTLVSIVANVVTLVLTLAIMLSLEWRLTLAGVVILPLFVLPARRVGRLLREITREQMNLNARMNALMNETLNVSGALLVKLFGRGPDENARFARRASAVRDIGIRQAIIGRWFFLSLSLVSAVGTAIVFWLGGYLVMQGDFTIGTIVAFSAYLGQLYGPLTALTNARVEFATSMVSFERVFEVLDLPLDIDDAPGALALTSVKGNLCFEDVSFSYGEIAAGEGGGPQTLTEVTRWQDNGESTPTASASAISPDIKPNGSGAGPDQPAPVGDHHRWGLRNVSFEIKPGQLAALVGLSGAGKTTITYLLPRLYDPTGGRILIDGHDLRSVTLASLAGHIGMVTQETYLFNDTIRANLLYARPEATPEELESACRAANIHDFIADLPKGYDTIVGERGYRLSGGEKQRLAIARVVLKDPRILVLDEATSNLDSQSEALIQNALERVMLGRTSLVIAHRLSTILSADVILVLDQGKVIEQGNHEELLARGGMYATLYHTQFRRQKPGSPLKSEFGSA
ncbi:MAG: ABC transporter ATP-binding protein [Dehalococcoidia bacterium]|nr:ABC transporter ATP-binding protein [Dehalococcoidia bacterium]